MFFKYFTPIAGEMIQLDLLTVYFFKWVAKNHQLDVVYFGKGAFLYTTWKGRFR